MSRLADPTHVAAQYATPDALDARVRLYRLYATGRPTWLEWLWDQIALTDGERILEVGTGSGNLWLENAPKIPAGSQIVLSDLSSGMLDAARDRLEAIAGPFAFERADAQRLPFSNGCFDVAIANHMLYHVPDRGAALSELARVLAPDGRCCVATNDWTHQIEIRELVVRFEIAGAMIRVGRDEAAFDLECAANEMAAHFGDLRVARRDDHLAVTDAAVLGDYVRSACADTADNRAKLCALEAHVASRVA